MINGTDYRPGRIIAAIAMSILVGTAAVSSAMAEHPFSTRSTSWLNELTTASTSRNDSDMWRIQKCNSSLFRCLPTPGTLFQWSGSSADGGPDRNAPLVTDRPDFTEASSTVGCGVAQLEFGYTYAEDDSASGSTKSHSYPETLLRYGVVAEWLELRMAWNHAEETTNGARISGSEDLYLGFKMGLTPQDGILPETALIPQMTVPTGAAAFSANRVLPGANLIYGWEINDLISTAGSTQVNGAIDDVTGAGYTEWAQSWTVAYTLGEKLGAYTEWFALFPDNADTVDPEHYFNGGLTYLINDDIQFDVRAGTGLNGAADDFFVGTGLSVRYK